MNRKIEHSFPLMGGEEKKVLSRIIDSSFVAQGVQTRLFEKEFAECFGIKYAIAVNSGTSALHLALLALNVGKSDEVIIPNYVCRSVLNAVQYCGAKPVLCDVDRDTYNISPEEIKRKITSKTKAIIVAHMFGMPVAIDEISRISKEIPVIEDCAQSIGARYKGRFVGNFGQVAVFSFEGTKTITTGEGGMIVTNSYKLYGKLMRLKGLEPKEQTPVYTYRMSDLQAAVGRVQLKRLPGFIKKRRIIAGKYVKAFKRPGINFPIFSEKVLNTFHRFILTMETVNIDHFIRASQKKGVMVKRAIKPFGLNKYLGISDKSFPNTKFIMGNCISIPIYPALKQNDIKKVIDVVSCQLRRLKL
ncbi:MAG: DegT/DnrJ/EryC1/StrS family aminotransferase [PVC group bacterium]|nr:DegT/DnrJ/EryC1/StrS family aminotransferase [PVC group bacterium]